VRPAGFVSGARPEQATGAGRTDQREEATFDDSPRASIYRAISRLLFSPPVLRSVPVSSSLLSLGKRVLLILFPLSSIKALTMRFNAALTSALVSSAGLMGYVLADETEAPAPDATSSGIERPTFTVRLS
jgi:hypothetical protein